MAEGGEGGYAVNGGIFCFIFLYCLSKHSKHYFTYMFKQYKQFKKILHITDDLP